MNYFLEVETQTVEYCIGFTHPLIKDLLISVASRSKTVDVFIEGNHSFRSFSISLSYHTDVNYGIKLLVYYRRYFFILHFEYLIFLVSRVPSGPTMIDSDVYDYLPSSVLFRFVLRLVCLLSLSLPTFTLIQSHEYSNLTILAHDI